MAGIGFQLKQLIDSDDSYFHKIRTYTYSLLVVYGPLFICILSISYIQGIMSYFNIDIKEAQLFSRVIGYIFSASNVTTGVIALVLTRYVSDAIFLKDNKKVLPSLYGGTILTLIPGMLLYWGVLFFTGTDLLFSILTGVFFGLINVVWLLLIYLGALSNHQKILKIFMIGTIITLLSLMLCGFVNSSFLLYYIIISLNLGFTCIGAMLLWEIKDYFGEGEGSIFAFMEYIKKYPSLIFINIFYILGLYFEGFYNEFFSPNQDVNFLEIVFVGVFVLIPGMMYFIIRFETSYFEKHNSLFSIINKMGTYEDIALAKENLINLVKFEFKMLYRAVFIFTLIIMFLGIQYFLFRGASQNTIISFCIFAIGMCLTVFMYVVKILFLYFDLRKFALIITSSFLLINILISLAENYFKLAFMGLGILGGSFISILIGIISLLIFFKKIDYYLFRVS